MSQTKPFFIPQKEIDLINVMNEELIDEIIGQSVDIYKVNVETTNENMYGESSTKYYDKGFRVNCLIDWAEPIVEQDDFGVDVNTTVDVYFHRNTLKEADFFPEIGDIIDWNNIYFEINSVIEPKMIGSHQNYKHSIKVTAHRSRLSSLQIEERPK